MAAEASFFGVWHFVYLRYKHLEFKEAPIQTLSFTVVDWRDLLHVHAAPFMMIYSGCCLFCQGKKKHLCTGNSSLSRDEWMACSLNTAGRVDRSDRGHWATWEWNSSGKHVRRPRKSACTHQSTIYDVQSQRGCILSFCRFIGPKTKTLSKHCYNCVKGKHIHTIISFKAASGLEISTSH